jgi:Ulp1 protease family, C-terminal catalytic domain
MGAAPNKSLGKRLSPFSKAFDHETCIAVADGVIIAAETVTAEDVSPKTSPAKRVKLDRPRSKPSARDAPALAARKEEGITTGPALADRIGSGDALPACESVPLAPTPSFENRAEEPSSKALRDARPDLGNTLILEQLAVVSPLIASPRGPVPCNPSLRLPWLKKLSQPSSHSQPRPEPQPFQLSERLPCPQAPAEPGNPSGKDTNHHPAPAERPAAGDKANRKDQGPKGKAKRRRSKGILNGGSEFDAMLRNKTLDSHLHRAEREDRIYEPRPQASAGIQPPMWGAHATPKGAGKDAKLSNVVDGGANSPASELPRNQETRAQGRARHRATNGRRVKESFATPVRHASQRKVSDAGESSRDTATEVEVPGTNAPMDVDVPDLTRAAETEGTTKGSEPAGQSDGAFVLSTAEAKALPLLAGSQPKLGKPRAKRRRSVVDLDYRSPSIVEPVCASPATTSTRLRRRRMSTSLCANDVIDLTQRADDDAGVFPEATARQAVEETNAAKAGGKSSSPAKDLVPHACGRIDTTYIEPPMLKPLTEEEQLLVNRLTKGKGQSDALATNPIANIVLRRSDFKRLRGTRWLNDELLNSYAALINMRNSLHFERASKDAPQTRPRTYIFNTYFHTRLMSTGYDYAGVARWTRRAKMNVLDRDLILVPVNLGNNHWVLSGIDMRNQCFLYLDSLHGRDSTGVVLALRHWLYDEVKDKHGIAEANSISVDAWEVRVNKYDKFQETPAERSGSSPGAVSKPRPLKIPRQRDGGSCGVFTAKIADCLAMGCKVYFGHENIKLIRNRMALDLYNRVLPG